MKRSPVTWASLAAMIAVVNGGCLLVKSDPVEVKPIEINVNIRVKVDRELDGFFADLDQRDATLDGSDAK